MAWPILVGAFQKKDLHVRSIDISNHRMYDSVFCSLNPFIAGGHIDKLVMRDMRGDPVMVEGLCGSLLLNTNLTQTSLVLDDLAMECRREGRIERVGHFQERLISLVAQSNSLQELSVRNCNMNDVCISMLCDVLIKFENCKLRRLYIDGNLSLPEVGKCSQMPKEPSHKASSYLCTLLTESKTLEVLSMNGCHGLLASKIAEGLQASRCGCDSKL